MRRWAWSDIRKLLVTLRAKRAYRKAVAERYELPLSEVLTPIYVALGVEEEPEEDEDEEDED